MPISQVEWGSPTPYRHGNSSPLTHDSSSSYMHYDTGTGSVVVFPKLAPADLPQPIIAVAVWYQQGNGGLFTMYNGWVEAQLMFDGTREPASRSYVQDGTNTRTVRTYTGPPVYRPGMEAWTAEEINRITASVGAAVGPIAPVKSKRWCQCNGVKLALYTADPVPVPTFNSAPTTISTSSVNFSANITGMQRAQPVRAVFQVARDSDFTEDVRSFVGTLRQPDSDGATVTSVYTSVPDTPSWTDLGPGRWYLRVRGQDYLGNESAWSAHQFFTINHSPLTDVVLLEPGTSVVRSPYAIRSVHLTGTQGRPFDSGVRVGARWQFSQVSDFASGVVQWLNLDGLFEPGVLSYDPAPGNTDPGQNSAVVCYRDPSQYLTQGIWYAQARAEDKYGQYGAWSPVRQFTVSHPPTPTPSSPMGGDYFDPEGGTLAWDFIDAWGGDQQTAYEVVVKDAAGGQVFTSGWVTSSLARAVVDSPPASELGKLFRWQVRARDRDGVAGPWSSEQQFRYVLRPTVLVTSPEPLGYAQAGQPEIRWDVALYPGATQAGYRVVLIDKETRRTVYNSGYVIDNVAAAHRVEGIYLDNMTTHEVIVRITDSNALTGEHRTEFTTNFVLPPTVATTASPTTYEPEGYVRVLWSGAVDPLFEEWRVYRRHAEGGDWTLAARTPVASAREAKDWTACEAGTFIYAVVQVASRDGSLVEGSRENTSAPITLRPSSYWLVVPELDMGLRIVPSNESMSRERESSSMDIIGRGRKMNFGPAIVREGSLTVPVRHLNRGMSASELIDRIDLITTGVTGVYLRDPFGNYFAVALGRYSLDRMSGVGPTEMGDVEISYVEVFE